MLVAYAGAAATTVFGVRHENVGQQDLVLGLPHDLAVGLLSLWLRLPDVAHLDSAICNHKKRGSLLSLLSSPEMLFGGISLEYLGAICDRTSKLSAMNDYLNWLCERHAKVLELSLMDVSFDGEVLMKYLQMNGLSIVRLKFEGKPGLKPAVAVRPRVPAELKHSLQHVPNCQTVAFSGFDLSDKVSDDLETLLEIYLAFIRSEL